MPDYNIELGRLSISKGGENGRKSIQDDPDGAGGSSFDRDTSAEDARAPGDDRVIFINRAQPPVPKFANNRISTAKYSLIRFIPLFLFEQFRRWANCFFLMIALLQQIPDVSPTGRYTTLVPLLFILSVSALKEIIEDVKRHRADDETNHSKVDVLRGSWISVRWKEVVVGDIVKVTNNKFFPADLVLISSSEPKGISFIETANLDGETNLKIRQALPSTQKCTTTQHLNSLSGTIECEPPNRHLYEFNGVLRQTNKKAEPLGPDQILLRGAMLRNTSWVYGIVIYTGHETKLMRNSTVVPLKRSSVDRLTNVQILLLFCILLAMCLLCSICNVIWTNNNFEAAWYIGIHGGVAQLFFYNLLTFIILFNNLIPISLQVTLEVVRFIQAIFINQDLEMYDPISDTPALARTSNLNEELGQVKYVFSDKTGTLTRNIMEFKKCAVGPEIYLLESSDDSTLLKDLEKGDRQSDLIRELLVLLSVCHTVIPEKLDDGSTIYHAASPDEKALVDGASKFGYEFKDRTPEYVEINARGKTERYEIMSVLDFTSARKRMSVIVRGPDGKIKLFCKGADTVIYERLDANGRENGDILLRHLEHFATEGLRTLCYGVAELKPEDYHVWAESYMRASISIQHREEKIEESANMIERKLRLIGATAIEDKLQDGVPETIAALLQADINVWVLTGDKQETAINIGYSCKLLSQNMRHIIINEDSLDSTRETILKCIMDIADPVEKHVENALIVDGKTLKYALSCELRNDFLKLSISCKVVICCRVSPMQKAEVVEYVTEYTKTVTLAIGDGANDVAMIQKAHVGVGISGMEGLQAACASDYSIAQFRFLLRLLLVHGSWNYSRMCKLILYSFYKNICLYVIELWYAIYSGWSGQILFEQWSIGMYNVLFTALPPLVIGLFDKPCNDDKMLLYPKLYKPSQNGEYFNVKVFWIWIINGLVHSALLFWITLFICRNDVLWMSGKEGGYLVFGNFVYTFVIITVCFKASLVINAWTWITHAAIWGSIALWFIFIIVYSFFWPIIPVGSVMAGMYLMVFSSATFWLAMAFVPTITMLPDFLVKINIGQYLDYPSWFLRKMTSDDISRAQSSDRSPTKFEKQILGVIAQVTRPLDLIRKFHGFAFSQEEGGAVSQAEVIRAYNTTNPKVEEDI